ncbi:MAG: rod shape-determining protein MreD [Christensenellales bacterium]|jgi:cell shape-determining protein MreD
MGRTIVFGICIVLSVALQAVVTSLTGIVYTGPDALLCMVIAISAFTGPAFGAAAGGVTGFLGDAVFRTGAIGQLTVLYIIAGAVCGYFFDQSYRRFVRLIALSAAFSVFRLFWLWVPRYVGGLRLDFFQFMGRVALPNVFWTVALAALLYAILYQVQRLRFMARRLRLDDGSML